uniref:Anaphase-promoting complex subunit 13 n=1 Tax=Hucho hucho TaxID=62062 RepID=A0A4W5LUF8_9TELE
MDSLVQRDSRVLDITDDAWREDSLLMTMSLSNCELPEAEQDNGGSTESVKEQEIKWLDLALQSLHEIRGGKFPHGQLVSQFCPS